jgi:hypothetical protein
MFCTIFDLFGIGKRRDSGVRATVSEATPEIDAADQCGLRRVERTWRAHQPPLDAASAS